MNVLKNKWINFIFIGSSHKWWIQFCISVFGQKNTVISLLLNDLGFTPFSCKVGLVKTLEHHPFMITSDCCCFCLFVVFFHVEVALFRKENFIPNVLLINKSNSFLKMKWVTKLLQLFLPIMLLNTINYLILVIFQQMSSVRLMSFVNYCKDLNKGSFNCFYSWWYINVKDLTPKSLKSFVE